MNAEEQRQQLLLLVSAIAATLDISAKATCKLVARPIIMPRNAYHTVI